MTTSRKIAIALLVFIPIYCSTWINVAGSWRFLGFQGGFLWYVFGAALIETLWPTDWTKIRSRFQDRS